jgi:hypothetical protein
MNCKIRHQRSKKNQNARQEESSVSPYVEEDEHGGLTDHHAHLVTR